MSFFKKPIVNCGICGREIDTKEKRWKTKDGFICPDCQKPFGIFDGPRAFIGYDNEQIKEMKVNRQKLNELLQKNRELFNSFKATRIIEKTLFIDDNLKKWYFNSKRNGFMDINGNTPIPLVFDFSDVLEVYTTLGDKIITSTSSTRKEKGVRNIIAGTLLAGNTGAILGGMLSKNVTTSHSIESQNVYVNVIIDSTQDPISMSYHSEHSAEKARSVLAAMIDDPIEKFSNIKSNVSVADEIRKFKKLLNEDIITEEEFESKKNQLLNL